MLSICRVYIWPIMLVALSSCATAVSKKIPTEEFTKRQLSSTPSDVNKPPQVIWENYKEGSGGYFDGWTVNFSPLKFQVHNQTASSNKQWSMALELGCTTWYNGPICEKQTEFFPVDKNGVITIPAHTLKLKNPGKDRTITVSESVRLHATATLVHPNGKYANYSVNLLEPTSLNRAEWTIYFIPKTIVPLNFRDPEMTLRKFMPKENVPYETSYEIRAQGNWARDEVTNIGGTTSSGFTEMANINDVRIRANQSLRSEGGCRVHAKWIDIKAKGATQIVLEPTYCMVNTGSMTVPEPFVSFTIFREVRGYSTNVGYAESPTCPSGFFGHVFSGVTDVSPSSKDEPFLYHCAKVSEIQTGKWPSNDVFLPK